MGLLGRSCFLAFLVDWAPHRNHHHSDICQSLSSFGFRFLSHTSNRLTCIAFRSVRLASACFCFLYFCASAYHRITRSRSLNPSLPLVTQPTTGPRQTRVRAHPSQHRILDSCVSTSHQHTMACLNL